MAIVAHNTDTEPVKADWQSVETALRYHGEHCILRMQYRPAPGRKSGRRGIRVTPGDTATAIIWRPERQEP